MLDVYRNGIYQMDSDTPRTTILAAIMIQYSYPNDAVTIGNDFGDRWPLREYIEKIERFTAIRIPEKEHLPNENRRS